MKTNLKVFTLLGAFIFVLAVYLTGCVNYDQKTVLKSDGSGSMKIHYWTGMKNFSMGTTLGKFEFDETKAKGNYTSSNSEVSSIKVEDKLDDSTKHVNLELTFKDINKLSDAKGFEGVKATWKEETDGMKLTYTLLKDTSASGNMGASDYKITYEFEMPSEIVSTNGTKDGQKVKWNYTVADLSKDIDMTCVVKASGKKLCGIIGLIPAVFIIGLAFYTQRNRKRATNK
jgi:hypothetical protein